MDIVLIGSGNVATVLGKSAVHSGHRVVQVFSRNKKHAECLATELHAANTDAIPSVIRTADLLIVAIRDDSIPAFARAFGFTKSLIAHTAGAVSIKLLKENAENFGVLYPVQSLRKEIFPYPPIPFLVDGNNRFAREQLTGFAKTISGSVIGADDETRLKYHVSATIVNNFTNYLYTLAADFCMKEKLSFSILQPLIEETASRLRSRPARDSQTGPALRDDQSTLSKHRQLLAEYPAIAIFYDLFSKEIVRDRETAGQNIQ